HEQRGSRRHLPTPARILHELLPVGAIDAGVDLSHTPAPHEAVSIEAVSGACMLIRRTALDAVGGFDTAYPLHFEDLDLFARLQQHGWAVRWCPDVHITHVGGGSSQRSAVRVLWSKHQGLWRYLNLHCKPIWPRWQRPVWAVMLLAHATIKTPWAWLRSLRAAR
ncbi:MAG: glycosyltransferase family 2 protein, partial [Pseudomonadota bacterium]